nr:unknown function [Klebsiella phage vB_Kpn_K30lambda2.2]
MNLNSKERQVLAEALRRAIDNDLLDTEDTVEAIALIGKVEAAESDSWRPLSELPPLGLAIVVRRADGAPFNTVMVRKDLAKSYSPDIITLHTKITDEPFEFNTRHYYWRLKNA